MNKSVVMLAVLVAGSAGAHQADNPWIQKETIQCDEQQGCEVVCRQPGDRWSSYLKTAGNIEVTYFLNSGVRQLKADMGEEGYTILDTHPELQSCRISGVR
jgi:allophanate hydrolase subunit 2